MIATTPVCSRRIPVGFCMNKQRIAGWGVKLAIWFISLFAVMSLTAFIVLNDTLEMPGSDSVTLREVDITLPPPPEPPPPVEVKMEESSAPPGIDLPGSGNGPVMAFSDNPKLSMANIQKISKPDVDIGKVDLSQALSVNFPLLEVKDLDQIPRLVSTNRISFPQELRRKGVTRVETKVEIIIDQTGQAFVRKIVDPVYPEMTDVIRKAINDSKFTIPKKDGKAVQAIYLYTLVFINRT